MLQGVRGYGLGDLTGLDGSTDIYREYGLAFSGSEVDGLGPTR
jgi:hypothetical protein